MSTRDKAWQVRTGSNGRRRKTLPLERVPPRVPREITKRGPDELVLTAEKQLTIRCGESSITLTTAGKIIIRGKYIVSRSSGLHRIKGGSVQIN